MTVAIERFADRGRLAAAVAGRFVDHLAGVQESGREPQVVLTGGTIADAIHAAVASAADRDRVRWQEVQFWFGDERYVPRDEADRNALQARRSMLDHLPVDTARVHEMPAPDGEYADDAEAAALAYAAELAAAVPAEGPWFDLLMLGIGPDGHCASLFPGRPELQSPAIALAVRDSPKPPPTRITLGMPALARAREVWFVASGTEKAAAVAAALGGAAPSDIPAAGVSGLERTLWFLAEDAAQKL